MAAQLDEHTVYQDVNGKPLVNGKLYIGLNNADPVTNPITVYSDRALTVALANPQLLDANGRAANKIWIPGRYSIRVDDENDVQKYQELDAGEDSSAGITSLTNVQGADTITAEGVPAITGYVDKQLYTFLVALENTGAVTINIDGQGAIPIAKNFNVNITKGQFKQNQAVVLIYNATSGLMEWVNHNNKVYYGNKSTNIASAATVDLSLASGNFALITGNTGPISSFGTTPAGSVFYLLFDSTPTITHINNTNDLPGDADVTIAAGDTVRVISDGGGSNRLEVFRATGKALVETNPVAVPFTNMEVFTADGTWNQPDASVTTVVVVAVGSGGGGAGGSTATDEGGGGGSGCVVMASVTVSGNITVTVEGAGAGGAGGGANNGTAGASTTFGSLVTAPGGLGGVSGSTGAGGSGGGGGSTTGTMIFTGDGWNGEAGVDATRSGNGGASPYGGGAGINPGVADNLDSNSQSSANSAGGNATNPGNGGGGARGNAAGGNGADGYIIVWW